MAFETDYARRSAHDLNAIAAAAHRRDGMSDLPSPPLDLPLAVADRGSRHGVGNLVRVIGTLQRTCGNEAVQRLFVQRRKSTEAARPRPRAGSAPTIQRAIGNDLLERASGILSHASAGPRTATAIAPGDATASVQRLVTAEQNKTASTILTKGSGNPHSILVVPSDFNLGTNNPGVTLRKMHLVGFKPALKNVLKGYADQNWAGQAIDALGEKSILIKEDVFSQDDVYQSGVIWHEWGHVVGATAEEAGVFATELELLHKHFGAEKTCGYMSTRQVSYYKQAVVSGGSGVERLTAILTTLKDGADSTTARLIDEVVEHLQKKKTTTTAGIAKKEAEEKKQATTNELAEVFKRRGQNMT